MKRACKVLIRIEFQDYIFEKNKKYFYDDQVVYNAKNIECYNVFYKGYYGEEGAKALMIPYVRFDKWFFDYDIKMERKEKLEKILKKNEEKKD